MQTMFKGGNVTVTVSDMNKSVKFYVETLGLTLQYEPDGHFAQIQAPGLTIGLLHLPGDPAGESGSQDKPSGAMSIGFEVQDLESVVRTLESRGVRFHNSVDGKAAQVVHFSDPDGNTLYLVRTQ
jgi:catechol 2,3-dioxygenase-like lactoylglutathione lyase family enzyme